MFKLILVIDGWGISCELALRWMSLDFTDDQSMLVQVMAWCRQATSHYMSQCWPRSLSPYGVTRPQWVNYKFGIKPHLSGTNKLIMYDHKQHLSYYEWSSMIFAVSILVRAPPLIALCLLMPFNGWQMWKWGSSFSVIMASWRKHVILVSKSHIISWNIVSWNATIESILIFSNIGAYITI